MRHTGRSADGQLGCHSVGPTTQTAVTFHFQFLFFSSQIYAEDWKEQFKNKPSSPQSPYFPSL